MKHKSNKSSMQNITVPNLLHRLESLNFCTYKTNEYYETLRASHLPQKLKFWKWRKFGNITVLDLYFINWKLLIKPMPLFTKSMLKTWFNKNRNRPKQKRLFPSYIESPNFNTNPNNIKLQMLQERKQPEEKIQSI